MSIVKFRRIEPLQAHTLKKKYVLGSFDDIGTPNARVREVGTHTVEKNTVTEKQTYTQPGRESWAQHDIEYNNRTNNSLCAIVIPVYKLFNNLRPFEKASIKQVIKILGGKYDIILAYPEGLDISGYNIDNYKFSSVAINKDFFKSQKTYSNLCERKEFYELFKAYKYMLIYQTDAWIFEDKIGYFCDKGYDYIGGVHLLTYSGNGGQNGNGGFSLRKVEKFINVCGEVDWKSVPYGQLEDCAFTQRLKSKFNLAPLEICYEFSWHEKGGMCFNKTHKLPMGCHAFKIHDWAFWSKYISF